MQGASHGEGLPIAETTVVAPGATIHADATDTGAGGVLASFRIGPMPVETASRSLELFMTRVAPAFRQEAAVTA